ncbi:MAG: hypothetical protein KDH96_09870 [Candidatus Riesia sp.]|nr:hypothetical protein [Candidatus Riesia sp.]
MSHDYENFIVQKCRYQFRKILLDNIITFPTNPRFSIGYISTNQIEEFVNDPEVVGMLSEKFLGDISEHQDKLREKLFIIYSQYHKNIANMISLNLERRDEYFQFFINFIQ